MNADDLIGFNPILAKAMAQAEKKDPYSHELLKMIVAACIGAGAEPEKIYATIKTGRMLTKDNMKSLTDADLKEWSGACREYKRLATKLVDPRGRRQT